MLGFVLRRLAAMAAVLFVLATVLFFLLHLSPDSPVNSLAPSVAASPAAKAAFLHRYGLDRSLWVQYVDYLGDTATGRFGRSIFDGSSVWGDVAGHLPVSIELGLSAGLLAVVPGVAFGAWLASAGGRAVDVAGRVLTVVALSVPSYWLAVVLMVLLGSRLPALFPQVGGYVPFTEDPAANLEGIVLPAVLVALPAFALVARSARVAVAEVLASDYVAFARGMGMTDRQVLWRVGLRNALVPVLTVMGVVVAGMMAGAVLVEDVFGIPGIGNLLVGAFGRKDYPLALGATLVTALIFLVLNLLVDVGCRLADPRTARDRAPVGPGHLGGVAPA
ncbi:MAG TPA: ABC transporter permease [Acidimicrobiales bacterium]|nr:ABC transporter permease [Acidimicrobiales bacterium]